MNTLNVLNTEEFAQLARVTPQTARFWRHANRGPRHFHMGKRVYYKAEDVQEWLDTQYVKSNPEAQAS